jgi:hypothetical protein
MFSDFTGMSGPVLTFWPQAIEPIIDYKVLNHLAFILSSRLSLFQLLEGSKSISTK